MGAATGAIFLGVARVLNPIDIFPELQFYVFFMYRTHTGVVAS